MSVIIKYPESFIAKQFLLSSIRSLKPLQRFANGIRLKAVGMQKCHDRHRVGNIFLSQQVQRKFPQRFTSTLHSKPACSPHLGPVIGRRVKPVTNRSRVSAKQLQQTRIIRTKNEPFMGLFSKSHKLIAHRLEVGEIIQVLLIDIEHDGLFGMKLT